MEFKVCILAAGKNDRLKFVEDFPVAILPIGTASSITKIIEKFPLNIEIVMAVGYKSKLIKDFIKIAHSNRKITFVDIDDYSATGSGPGKSLLLCKEHLMCPFIFTSGDTIVSGSIPEPSKNWIGVSHVSDTTNYLTADVENNYVTKLYDKVPVNTLLKICKNPSTILNNTFIGMAGVYDYKVFWESLEFNQHLIQEKLQVSNGLNGLVEKKLEVFPFFNWFLIGTESGYSLANRFFNKNPILVKPDEFIYFENGKVIKYFRDPKIIRERILRSQMLEGIVPPIVDITENFYSYNFIKGKTLPKINDVAVFKELLNSCKEAIWREKSLGSEKEKFKEMCKKFYRDKTYERLEMFFLKSGIKDKEEIINGEKSMKVGEMLSLIDWDKLSEGIPVNFHGDFQPENILICDKGFQLIDWRHSFAGNIDYGDVYYDFAKLYHALIVTHDVIRDNQFEIKINNDVVNYDFFIKSNLAEYKDIFERFIVENGYDIDKIKILSALIFLNLAALFYTPYDNFLYYLGKYSLFKELENNNTYKLKKLETTENK